MLPAGGGAPGGSPGTGRGGHEDAQAETNRARVQSIG